jgi:hypothetical protein
MCQESSPTPPTHSDVCLQDLLAKTLPSKCRMESGSSVVWSWDHKDLSRGGSSTPSTLASRSGEGESGWRVYLSDILERGPLSKHYFLSRKAKDGILRRAQKRGKKLPELLERALRE